MVAFLVAWLLAAGGGDYCVGYRQGYTAAYCQGHGATCRSAPVPACSGDGTWQEGYDRGYSDGEGAHPRHPGH